jgi:superfamily II DNA/RNA helicase
MNSTKNKATKSNSININVNDWNTTDADEIKRRQLRGQTEKFSIKNTDPTQMYFSSFSVNSKKDQQYRIEIRSLSEHINSCDCPDYRSNGLGTCKHIEYVLFRLRKAGIKLFKQANINGNPNIEIFLDARNSKICVLWPKKINPKIRAIIDPFFSVDGTLLGNPIAAYPSLLSSIAKNHKFLRISQHINYFIEYQQRVLQKHTAKEIFLHDVSQGKRTLDIIKYPLYPYQQNGMLHLAFNERALLADDMGLGKTVQAIAACELLRRYKNITRVLIVATASLKTEWEEQIAKFADLPTILIQGTRANRLNQYQKNSFFYLTNYEQIIADGADIQRLLTPDVIILDEAQRIKNWHTKTAIAIKQLKTRYAFVLTGTPLENRIDDIFSIVQFLDPHVFGPLFQFNRDFYNLDEKGRPIGYRNLDELHKRLKPIMLRRHKNDVEGQLPKRTVNNYFVSMDDEQNCRYGEYQDKVTRLLFILKKRPLYKEEHEKLQKWLGCMRMLCDTPFILDPICKVSPKLIELNNILEELLSDNTTKIIIFSEWERMLQLVRELLQKKRLDFSWHTGSVPQQKRRLEIKRFKTNPDCRLFLSTDSGGLGLNLQNANIVINLDLPWNPAKLEQRIARAWRKHQTRSVQVINLVSENTIEHRMLSLLAQKQELAKRVIEGAGDLKEMHIPSGRVAFIEKLETLMRSTDENLIIKTATKTSAKKTDNLHDVCDTLLANMKNNIELLQTHHNQENNQDTVLAIINNNSEDIKKQIQQHMQQQARHISINPQSKTILLEILDKQIFETIQRLAQAGILTLNIPTEVLHTSSKFSEIKNAIKENQINKAKKHLELALRKQRMAQLLINEDFYEESFAPLREALELTIKAFAFLNNENNTQEPISNTFIKEILVKKFGLPQIAETLFLQLDIKKSTEICKTNPSNIKNLLTQYQEIIDYVNTSLYKTSDT